MNSDPSLAQQLFDYKAGFLQRAAPERVATMETATANLKAAGIEANALKVGETVPDVDLTDATGKAVSLSQFWNKGPLVVIFYRGGWCPYCNLELRAWQKHLGDLADLGASLVAISPQTPDNSLTTSQKNELSFAVLSDSKLEAARAFRIAFEMPPELIEIYSKAGNDLSVVNGNGRWVLPLPATYVIDQSGKVIYNHIEADYRERAEPADVLRATSLLRAFICSNKS